MDHRITERDAIRPGTIRAVCTCGEVFTRPAKEIDVVVMAHLDGLLDPWNDSCSRTLRHGGTKHQCVLRPTKYAHRFGHQFWVTRDRTLTAPVTPAELAVMPEAMPTPTTERV